MIFLLAAIILFFFLALGTIVFLICVLVPPSRKYALSTALWFAIWGPCVAAFLFLAVFGLIAGGIALQATHMKWEDTPRLISAMGTGSLIVGAIAICLIASIAAWLHQAAIHRITFALFRIYATFVVAGIGSVLGLLAVLLAIGWLLPAYADWAAALSVPVLMALFGFVAYKSARALRGSAPTHFTWITADEFAGPENPDN